MELRFANNKLRKRCESRTEAVRAWGPECADKLFLRLAELEAAESLADVMKLPAARCHQLRGRRAGQFAVDLTHPRRLVFRPAGDTHAFVEKNAIVLGRVVCALIEEVVDYHE